MSGLPPPLRVTSHRVAGALLWVALLSGVFAMHGLSAHGVTGLAAETSLATNGHGVGVVHDATPGGHGLMPAGHPVPDGSHTGMATLCLAVLLTAIVVAWMVGFLRRRPILTSGRMEHRYLPRPGTTHPPPLARFSVMRC